MLKEKELLLDPEQIKQLLEGDLHWKDIEEGTPLPLEETLIIESPAAFGKIAADEISAATEEAQGEEVEESNSFQDNEMKSILQTQDEEDIEEETKKGFGGFKLILLLLLVAGITFGTWYYFIRL